MSASYGVLGDAPSRGWGHLVVVVLFAFIFVSLFILGFIFVSSSEPAIEGPAPSVGLDVRAVSV